MRSLSEQGRFWRVLANHGWQGAAGQIASALV